MNMLWKVLYFFCRTLVNLPHKLRHSSTNQLFVLDFSVLSSNGLWQLWFCSNGYFPVRRVTLLSDFFFLSLLLTNCNWQVKWQHNLPFYTHNESHITCGLHQRGPTLISSVSDRKHLQFQIENTLISLSCHRISCWTKQSESY